MEKASNYNSLESTNKLQENLLAQGIEKSTNE